MELWVRSQSKIGLYIVDEIYIDERDFGNDDIQHYVMFGQVRLGTYKSKERALEILDEIQNILKPRLFANVRPSEEMEELLGGLQHGKTLKMKNDFEYKELSTYVYEMPEE